MQKLITEKQLSELLEEQISEALRIIDSWDYYNYEEKIL